MKPDAPTLSTTSSNSKNNKDFISSFQNITYLSSINYILYIKIFFFNIIICQHERLNLREIINLYIADGLYKYQANYIDSKMNLADVQNICDYIMHKIKNSNLLTLLNESPLFNKRFLIKQKPDYRLKMKANAGVDQDDNVEDRNGVHLYTRLLFNEPYISVSARYDKYREAFIIYMHRHSDSEIVVKEFKLSQVAKKIPFVEAQLKMGNYTQVGRMVLDKYENFLKIYSRYTLDILGNLKNKENTSRNLRSGR